MDKGCLRELGGVIADLGGDSLLPERLAELAAIDPQSLPLIAPKLFFRRAHD
jgi:hypothetical protein